MVDVKGGPVKRFLVKQFLPIGFTIAVFWALIWPVPGDWLYHISVGNHWKLVTTINICIIFFNFGLTLETSELKSALKNSTALITGIIMILVGTSLTGFIPIAMNFKPPEFGMGLAIFACCPTSLSQGVTVTIQGYGNAALALLLVVTTNLIGIITTPIFVKIVLGSLDANLDGVDLLVKLLVSILMPLILGKGIRELIKPAKEFASHYKVPIYMATNFQVIMIVWQTLSASRDNLLHQNIGDTIGAILAAVLQHMAFLFINAIIGWAMRMKAAERKAFIIMASQKSLPTAAVIIAYLQSPDLDVGLIAIPCIIFYVLQLFIDSFIANGWASKYEKAAELLEKYKDELDELARADPNGLSLIASKAQAAAEAKVPTAAEAAAAVDAKEHETMGLLSQGDNKVSSS